MVAITDSNGTVLVRYKYDAWGNGYSYSGASGLTSLASYIASNNPFRYRGYYYDTETNFYYLNSRYYDPEVGRFLNADGYISTGQGLTGYNMYVYCNNNPVMYTDSEGDMPDTFLLKFAALTTGYSVAVIGSLFNEDIRKDMNRIHWNPFNTDAKATANATHISFYRGQVAARQSLDNGRSGSFVMMFLYQSDKNEITVKHEYGHFLQMSTMDVGTYLLFVGLPSWASGDQPEDLYYSNPWDKNADVFGEINRGNYREGSNAWSIAHIIDPVTTTILYAIFGPKE